MPEVLFVRDVLRAVWRRHLMARYERELKEAERRFVGCRHEETMTIDMGVPDNPQPSRKCLQCWALELPDVAGGKSWCPNATSPEKAKESRFFH